MEFRQLGQSGFNISEVGIGCWQFGGDWGPMEDNTAIDILAAAVESGTNFFDTADVYGSGRSESLIGRFLNQCNEPITIATKFGRAGNAYPDKYTKQVMRESAIGSIKRLGVEALDLLQLHCIPPKVLQQGDVFDWLRDLKKEGLIKHFGASVESVEEGLLCMEQEGLVSLQVIFNVFRQKLVDELLPQAKAKGVGIIVRLPLASGLLAGKFNTNSKFAETDHRNYNRDGQMFNVGETFAGLPFEIGVQLADELKPLVPDSMTMAQMTQRWILDQPEVSTVIPGASSPKQARENAVVSILDPLSEELHQKLKEHYDQNVKQHIRGPY